MPIRFLRSCSLPARPLPISVNLNHSQHQQQDWLYNLWAPVQNENVGLYVQKWSRIFRYWQQNIKPSMEPFWAEGPVWHGSHVLKNPSLTNLFFILLLTPIVQSTSHFWHLLHATFLCPLISMSVWVGSIFIHSSSSYEDHTMCQAFRKQNQKTPFIHSRISQSGRLLNILAITMPCDRHWEREMPRAPVMWGGAAGRKAS